MTKFHVNVCLEPPAAGDVDVALTAVAPFDHNLTGDWKPTGEWDWWRIGTCRGEGFAVRPEHEGDPRLLHGTTTNASRCAEPAARAACSTSALPEGRPSPAADPGAQPPHCLGTIPSLGVWMLGADTDPITEFTRDPPPDFDRAAAWAVTAFALLTADGHWIDTEQLGPFAAPHLGEWRAAPTPGRPAPTSTTSTTTT